MFVLVRLQNPLTFFGWYTYTVSKQHRRCEDNNYPYFLFDRDEEMAHAPGLQKDALKVPQFCGDNAGDTNRAITFKHHLRTYLSSRPSCDLSGGIEIVTVDVTGGVTI